MENKVKVWLLDILNAIEEIDSFLPDKKDFFNFRDDIKTKRAIERNLGIIGEAVGRIVSSEPQAKINNARKIIDTRNRIIHGYDSVSVEIIWSIVVRDLPKLEREIRALLEDE
jgi:uncharacterized protein with HEPN domain